MKLSVVLFASKTLADGTHPIMLRLFRKGKYYHHSLQISCKEIDWNDNDKECRKSFKRHKSFNKIIRDSKSATQKRIDDILADKKPFAIENIFEPTDNRESPTLISIIENQREQYARFNTRQKYSKLIRKLKEFGYGKLYVEEVDGAFLKAFYNRIKEGRKDSTIYSYMAVFETSLKSAVEKGYISDNPFKNTSFKYDKTTKKRALSRHDMDKLIVYYRDRYLESIYSNEHSLSKINSEYYALNMFLSSYYLQGLSLVDLASLKVKDVIISDKPTETDVDYKQHHKDNNLKQFFLDYLSEKAQKMGSKESGWAEGFINHLQENNFIKEVEKEKIVTIETRRTKTNKPVKIVHKLSTVWFLLHPNMKDKNPNDYLFNIFNSKCEGNNKYQAHRLSYVTHMCNTELNKTRVALGLNIDYLTLYCARHTYASTLYHSGVNASLIAQNLGRDMRDMDVYLKQFDDKKIIDANAIL